MATLTDFVLIAFIKAINRESLCGLFDTIWTSLGVCGNADVAGGGC